MAFANGNIDQFKFQSQEKFLGPKNNIPKVGFWVVKKNF